MVSDEVGVSEEADELETEDENPVGTVGEAPQATRGATSNSVAAGRVNRNSAPSLTALVINAKQPGRFPSGKHTEHTCDG